MEFGRGTFQFTESIYPFGQVKLGHPQLGRRVFLGLPQWGIPAWRGRLYSTDCPVRNFLKEYSERLDCVEVSSTYYSEVDQQTVIKWRDTVPKGFKFLPKWPKLITHESRLLHCQNEIRTFLTNMEILADSLGTSILQLPPSFSRDYTRELYHFLCQVPQGFPLAIEFRHSSWFENHRLYKRLEDYLVERNIGMVCSDTPGRRDVFHLSFTGNQNVIRFLSDEQKVHDEKRLQVWRDWLEGEAHSSEKGGDFYFVLHRPGNDLVPDLIPFLSPESYQKIQELLANPQQSLF